MRKKTRKISSIFLCLLMVATVFAALPINVGAGAEEKNKWLTDGNDAGKKDKFGTVNDEDLRFITNSEQRMVLTSEGNLGIGIIDPEYLLDVNGDVRIIGQLHIGEDGDPILEITPDGKVGIGTETPTEALDVEGNIHVSGSLIVGSTTTYSDGFIDLSTGTNLDMDSGTLFIHNQLDRVGIGTTVPGAKLDVELSGGWGVGGAATIGDVSNTATGDYGISMGYDSHAIGDYSIAMGNLAIASQYGSTAMGMGTTASGGGSTAMGAGTTASGFGSTAIGQSTTASEQGSIAMGVMTTSSGYGSTAMGYVTEASGYFSTAMGFSTKATQWATTAMGYGTTASGWSSTAMGYQTTASEYYSTAMGSFTIASGRYSTAMGSSIIADGENSFGIGLDYTPPWGPTPPTITQPNTMAIMGGNVGIGTVSPSTRLHVAGVITASGGDSDDWNTAYGWGDHALAGYLTSETDPVFIASPANAITGTDITNWDTAYGWGDHALAGYLTSETDPVFIASPASGITGADITNWDAAYGWGDHALAGYLTSESDPVFIASPANGITGVFGSSPASGILGADITNWDTAFGWGDHASAGYDTTTDSWTGTGDVYTTSGNVGIGTSSPNEKLTVEGTLSLGETTAPTSTTGYGKLYVKSSDSKLYFQDDGGSEYDLTAASGIGGSGSSGYIPQFIGPTTIADSVIRQNGGKIGIGTWNPGAKLDIHTDWGDGGSLTVGHPDNAATRDFAIAFGAYTTASGKKSFAVGERSVAAGENAIAMGHYATVTQFATDSIALGDGITVSGDGSVGIGLGSGGTVTQSNTLAIMGGWVGIAKVSPTCALDVVGDIRLTGKLTASGGVDPPYVSYSNESHESIRVYAEEVEDHEEIMLFWNGEASRMQIYNISEDSFYTITGELIP
jgi:hypothetical protein